MNQLSIIILILFGFTSCAYTFDKADLAIINTYSKGDTLAFVNKSGKIDSIEITDKVFYYNGYSEGYKGNPQECRIYYKTIPPGKMVLASFGGSHGDVYTNEFTFLSAVKYTPNEPATIRIMMLGFDANIPKSYISNKDKNSQPIELVHFCHDCFGVEATDVVKVQWKPTVGVLSYQRKDSTTFKLINKTQKSR